MDFCTFFLSALVPRVIWILWCSSSGFHRCTSSLGKICISLGCPDTCDPCFPFLQFRASASLTLSQQNKTRSFSVYSPLKCHKGITTESLTLPMLPMLLHPDAVAGLKLSSIRGFIWQSCQSLTATKELHPLLTSNSTDRAEAILLMPELTNFQNLP